MSDRSKHAIEVTVAVGILLLLIVTALVSEWS